MAPRCPGPSRHRCRSESRSPSGASRPTIEKVGFAMDSPLEGAVTSETVSGAKFPASWENTGNFAPLGLRERLLASNAATDSTVYRIIRYALEQGIYFGLAGN